MLSPEVRLLLTAPLDPARVSKRQGSGSMQLSYLEGHDAIRTANRIFGIGNWGYRTMSLTLLGEEPTERNNRAGYRVGYRAIVEVYVNGEDGQTAAIFSDTGYGDATDYSGSAITPHELASKEAVTDALKRCLKNLGDQFGLGLYDKNAPEHNGEARDTLGVLKSQVVELAQRRNVEMTPEAIATFFNCEPDDLQDELILRKILLEA